MSTAEPPPIPLTVEESGISHHLISSLVLKHMATVGVVTPSRIASHLKLSVPIVNALIKDMANLDLVESRGLAGSDMTSEIRYALSSKGNAWAADALELSQYAGPAPVSLQAFRTQIESQSIRNERIGYAEFVENLSHLVLPEELVHRLGPAMNSGRSILLYGRPGNGKTSIAEAIGHSFKDTIYLPYCIEIDGRVISFFDESIHIPVEDGLGGENDQNLVRYRDANVRDPRWIACRRPVVMTGGEFVVEMLDLKFDTYSKFYEAPLHWKATGGVFILDDFGRQRVPPQAILNRWIVPLERGYDFMTLRSGRKFAVPFDELVIFSTNIAPHDLVDDASLRRIYFKIDIPVPEKGDFLQIMRNCCAEYGLEIEESEILDFFEKYYERGGAVPAGHHPKYLVHQIISACDYYGLERRYSRDLLDHAWGNLFVARDPEG